MTQSRPVLTYLVVLHKVEDMAPREFLGGVELLVLSALAQLGDEAYGVPICKTIEDGSGRNVAVASVYAALERLEKKGYVKARIGEPSAERGGRARTYFRLTGQGARELRDAERTFTRFWRHLPANQG